MDYQEMPYIDWIANLFGFFPDESNITIKRDRYMDLLSNEKILFDLLDCKWYQRPAKIRRLKKTMEINKLWH